MRVRSLLFGCALAALSGACRHENKGDFSIFWEDGKAAGVSISKIVTGDVPADSLDQLLSLHVLPSQGGLPILGEWSSGGGRSNFRPAIPFTRGLVYEVRCRKIRVGGFEVPADSLTETPEVVTLYPTADTVPENMLKIYVQFSQPMAAGRSMRYLTVTRNSKDTLKGTFLDLQPELWNEEGTILTLWLDPGRIKRDLIPNRELGKPIEKGLHYVVSISRGWKSQAGKSLAQDFSKTFFVGPRDEQMPEPGKWKIIAPAKGTLNELRVDFSEPLTYLLVIDAIHVVNIADENIPGTIRSGPEERSFVFEPEAPWTDNSYSLKIETRLEDLAGNNLNRLFDQDVTEGSTKNTDGFVRLKFDIARPNP